MNDPFQLLTDADLRSLASALRSGRLAAPYMPFGVGRVVSRPLAEELADRMQGLADQGMRAEHLAVVVESILAARMTRPVADDAVELVWTGPEAEGVNNRDTAVVVRDLFAQATSSVMVAGFAVYHGRELFRGLAERLSGSATLHVRLYLDVHRTNHDTSSDSEVLRRFGRRFVDQDWPTGYTLPEVYYDPRSLSVETAKQSRLHAKCVVVDRRVAFVTSANFTEAAQERNIEAGVVIRSSRFAARLADHFGALADARRLLRLTLPTSAPTVAN